MPYKFKYGNTEIQVPKVNEVVSKSADANAHFSVKQGYLGLDTATGNYLRTPLYGIIPVSNSVSTPCVIGTETWRFCGGYFKELNVNGHSRFGSISLMRNEWIGFYAINSQTRKGWIGHNEQPTMSIENEVSGGGIRLRLWNGNAVFLTDNLQYPYFCANNDGITYCGISWSRWNTVFAKNGSISTSDETKKKNITSLDEKYYQLAEKIDIVSFQFKETDQKDNIGRTHIGAISQRVEKALEEVGLTPKDFAGFCKDQKYKVTHDEKGNEVKEVVKGEYDYSLRYDELSMLKIWYLEEKTKKLENDVKELKELLLQK